MKLNLIEEFLLIALDDDEGIFIADINHLCYGISGALLLELALEEKIQLKDGKLILTGKADSIDPLINQSINAFANEKERKVGFWIDTFKNNGKDIKNFILDELINKGILRRESGKILWVIPYEKFPTENPIPENKVRKRIEDIVLNDAKATTMDLMLLSLIDVCQLTREAFRDDSAYNIATKKIYKLAEVYENPQESDDPLLNLESAIISTTRLAVLDPTSALV